MDQSQLGGGGHNLLSGSHRPLSMINVDAKVPAKELAGRSYRVGNSLIHKDQGSFMPGQGTNMNLRQLSYVMHMMVAMTLEGMLLALDTEKAYITI